MEKNIKAVVKQKIMKYAGIAVGVVAGVAIIGGVIMGPIVGYAGLYNGMTTTGTGASGAGGFSTTGSKDWEQFLRSVEIHEGGPKSADGLNYVVYDDVYGNPTIGHGICLKSQDGYLNVSELAAYGIDSKKLTDDFENNGIIGEVSVDICDAIWENILKAKYDSIVASYPDLTTYQHYALTDVKYRRGNIDGFQDAYNAKWTEADNQYGNYDESTESFSQDSLYSFFNNGFTDTSSGVYSRKQDQWVLFKYGYYRTLDEYWVESGGDGSIYDAAVELHNAQTSWSYSCSTLTSGDIELAINSPYKTTCCATYVSSALYKAGYVTEAEINGINYNSANALRALLVSKGWEEITSHSDLQAEDIVFMDTIDDGVSAIEHVQICAEKDGSNYYWFNAGGNWSIQTATAPYLDNGCDSDFYIAYRPSK